MKYCPKCKAAYTDKYGMCLHCDRALVSKLKGKNRLGSLVSVYKNVVAEPVELVKDILEENGIKCIIKKPNPSRTFDEFRQETEILVKEQDQERAESILKKEE